MLLRWWHELLRWLGIGGEPSALEAMRDIQRAKGPSEADLPLDPDWRDLLGQLKSQVFSAGDRRRLWKRHWGRRIGGDPRPLDDIRSPTTDELSILRDLVQDLERGR